MSLFKPSIENFPAPTITPDAYAVPLRTPDHWFEEANEGELAVDVYETPQCFVVQATVAGVRPDDLTLSMHRDLLTIRGKRDRRVPHPERTYLTEECFWGTFSRSLLLPEPVSVARATAHVQHGVLTVELPKTTERTDITVVHEE